MFLTHRLHPLGLALAIVVSIPATARAEVSRSQEIKAEVFRLQTDGVTAFKEGRIKEAIPLLAEASRRALNSFRVYFFYGLALKADRQYQNAVAPLQVALELDPLDLAARIALGDCYLQRGDPAEALAEYHRALAQAPDYAAAHDGLGRAAEAAGEDDRAVEHFRKAIELNPGFPDASLNLGDLFLRDGRDEEAIDLFTKVIKVRPDFAAAYNRIGAAYAHQRLHNEAVAALRHAETLERGNAWHAVTVGTILLELDYLLLAERELGKALALDPDYLDAYQAMASLRRRHGDLKGAIERLDSGLSRESQDPRGRARLVAARELMVAEEKQIGDLESRLTAQPDERAALDSMAALRAAQGDHAAAVTLLEKALGAKPEPAAAEQRRLIARLGFSALRAGRCADAVEAYRKETSVAPADAPSWINFGLALAACGDEDGARSALSEAARLLPGDPRPRLYLGNLHATHGRRASAAEDLSAAIAMMEAGAPGRLRAERLLKAVRQEETK